MAVFEGSQSAVEFIPEFYLRDLKSAARKGEFERVVSLLSEYESQFGRNPFYAEAISWAARASLSKGYRSPAESFSRSAYDLAVSLVDETPVVAGSSLAIALGAAIEVQSQLLLDQDRRDEAVQLLTRELEKFAIHPFRIRIRKNLNLLSLAGEPAPSLDWTPLPGSVPGGPNFASNSPSLLLFWAHWCSDSRWQCRTLARYLEAAQRPLHVVAPTRLFGYITKGTSASEEDEILQLLESRQTDYPGLANAPIPFGVANFDNYGASTFPTLVGIHSDATVAFFHPGTLKPEELESRLGELR